MYIPDLLTDVEAQEIARLLAIEDAWWGTWYEKLEKGEPEKHWCIGGEDGIREISKTMFGRTLVEKEPLLDMRDHMWVNPLTKQEQPIGWVSATRIIPWEYGVVPTAINWFMRRFFGRELFAYQLFFYYQTQPTIMLVGGRGSAKTEGLAMTMAAWAALHPGQPWGHFAFTGAQATEAYLAIEELGNSRIPQPGQTEEEAPRSFHEVFVDKSTQANPYPNIKMKSWDIYDPGNFVVFRPLGQARGATTTRSMDVRRGSIDECTYDIADESILQVAQGSVRGTNDYWKRRLSEDERAEVQKALELQSFLDNERRSRQLTKQEREQVVFIERILRQKRITCHLGTILTGNRGPHYWVDEKLEQSIAKPHEIYARTVSYLINPHLDLQARRAYETRYSDPAVARVELFALRAIGRGHWFDLSKLLRCERKELNDLGDIKKHGGYTVGYERPYDPNLVYVLGSDPGTSIVPRRDSWNVQVWGVDMAVPVATLFLWRWGNINPKEVGSWLPFIHNLTYCLDIYKILQHNAIIQVGGQESGIAEVAYAEANRVSTVPMTGNSKAQMANYSRQLISKGFIEWPSQVTDLTIQLSDWDFKDSDLAQDTVMAFFSASWRLFQYFYKFLEDKEDDPEEKAYRPPRGRRRISKRKRRYFGQ